jgi:CRISPR-associated endonuclease/helicase Cas3
MCAAHRDAVINELRRRLDENEPVICISTQLIEAGVNISLECVIRDVAGLDSIYQAAGRCNRHGEFGEVKNVYIVDIADENLDKLPDIKIGAQITQRLFDDNNLDINEYYRLYFYARRGIMEYPIDDGGSIYDLLSSNIRGKCAYVDRKDRQNIQPPAMRSAIRSAADAFYVIERGRKEVIVPYKESADLVSRYLMERDIKKKRKLLREFGRYTVSLYEYQLKELEQRGAINEHAGISELARGFYHEERGVDMDGNHELLLY